MTVSPVRRHAATVAVLVGATALAGVSPAQAATDTENGRAATSLSVRAVHGAVRPGGSDRITGALAVSGPLTPAGRTVTLEARPAGATGFVPIAEATARERGGVGSLVTPETTTRYRWHYAGDDETRPSYSGVAVVRVRTGQHPPHRLATSLSIRATDRRPGVGVGTTVRGRLRAGRVSLVDRPVLLLARAAGATGWTFEAKQRTGTRGVAAFRVVPEARTAYRLAFLGTALLRPSRSGVVGVKPVERVATSLSIRGRAVPDDQYAVSGGLRGGGHALRGREVVLWQLPIDSSTWTEAATGTTGRHGLVRFRVPASPGTSYRLDYAGSRRFAPSSSGIVVS